MEDGRRDRCVADASEQPHPAGRARPRRQAAPSRTAPASIHRQGALRRRSTPTALILALLIILAGCGGKAHHGPTNGGQSSRGANPPLGSEGILPAATPFSTGSYETPPPVPPPPPPLTPSPGPRPKTVLHAPSGDGAPIYLGVWQPGSPQSMAPLQQFEQAAGKHAAIVQWYESWQGTPNGPDLNLLSAVAAHGSVPMISWGSEDFAAGPEQPAYNLAAILSGKYDGYVQVWAQKLAEYGDPVLLRWDWEMNGAWYPWGIGVDGNTTQQFVDAWRHLHDIFAAAGATNVQWVWSPNVVLDHEFPLESVYPGDAYVDWMALDGFNHVKWGWRSFTSLFSVAYQRLVAMSARPIMIAETSSSEADNSVRQGLSKAQWITSTLTQEIPHTFPQVRALIWFNDDKAGVENNGYDWRINSTPEAQYAFAQAIASSTYSGNWLGSASP